MVREHRRDCCDAAFIVDCDEVFVARGRGYRNAFALLKLWIWPVSHRLPMRSASHQFHVAEKNNHPTLSEVAKRAGVGTTTVSRVINGGYRVDPKTLIRVNRVIAAMGYMPNQAARVLKGDRTRTIGFIIPSIADPFFSSCAEAVQAVARAHDSVLIVLTTQNDPRAELDNVNVLMRHRADGFIIAPADSHNVSLAELILRSRVPVVALDRPIDNSSSSSVVADNFHGAELATRHLVEHGYTRVACLTGEVGLYTINERLRGYRHTLRSAELRARVYKSVRCHASAQRAVEKLMALSDPPDAILTLKNSTTIYTFEALQKLGISIPDQVALLGYDDFELADALSPSISVVEQPVEDIGRVAAELLFSQMLNKAETNESSPSQKAEQILLKTRLIARRSCGCTAVAR
jgi:LacI family transcriptional regulator